MREVAARLGETLPELHQLGMLTFARTLPEVRGRLRDPALQASPLGVEGEGARIARCQHVLDVVDAGRVLAGTRRLEEPANLVVDHAAVRGSSRAQYQALAPRLQGPPGLSSAAGGPIFLTPSDPSRKMHSA